MSIKLNSSEQHGFTLLEILLVLFLLGLMASTTLLLTEGVESQAKYDETKHRLSMIRTAIVGDISRTINGRPEISGFASDMGRLPDCLRELISQRYCDDSDDLPTWAPDSDSQVWAGWRGPYLAGNTELNGHIHFRDGYGNADDTSASPSDDWQNSGWTFTTNSGNLSVVSRGFNYIDATDDVPSLSSVQELIVAADYQVTLGSDWQNVDVEIVNEKSTHIVIEQDELRLRLNSPVDGVVLSYADSEFDTAAERNISAQFSNTFPELNENRLLLSANGTMEVNMNEELTFVPDATFVSGTTNTVTLLSGTVITYKVSPTTSSKFTIGSNCAPDCTLEFTGTSFTASGVSPVLSKLEFSDTIILTINTHYLAPTIITAKNLAKPSIEVPVGSSLTSSTVTLPLSATISLPSASAALRGVTSIVFEGTEITVSEAFTLSGTNVVTAISGDTFSVPNGTTDGSTANSLSIPATTIITGGVKSLSVVCESNSGSLYNGDCSTTESNTPTSLTLVPRNTLPINTSSLEWVIQ